MGGWVGATLRTQPRITPTPPRHPTTVLPGKQVVHRLAVFESHGEITNIISQTGAAQECVCGGVG